MITTMLLGTALAAGQPPAAAVPARFPILIPAQAPAPMPGHAGHAPVPMGTPAPAAAPANGGTAAPVVPLNGNGNGVKANGNGNGCEEAKPEEEEETKYFVERLLEGTRAGQLLSDRGIKVFGWTAMSYTGSSTSRSNGPITFNDRANEYLLNQNWLEFSKAIDTSKKEVQYGFRSSTIVPGSDYRFTLPRGLWNDQLARGERYGFDPVYSYAEVFLPNLGGEGTTLRAGRWGTGIGYEVIDAVNTPFVTKSYNFQYNPFTHTGVQATTQINEAWSMYHGATLGADVWFDPAARLMYVGGVKWAPKDGDTSVALNVTVTNPKFFVAEAFPHFNSYNTVITHKLSDKLTYVLDATFGHMDNIPGVGRTGGLGSAHWYGFANYFLYAHSDKLTSNFRVELFEDQKGVRTGFDSLYTALTYGVTWTPKDALLVRPFVRYDTNSRSRPFEGDNDIFLGGIELIVRW